MVHEGRATDARGRWEAGPLEVAQVPQPAEADLRVVAVAVHEDPELLGVGESCAVEDAQGRAGADGELARIEPERGYRRAEAVGQGIEAFSRAWRQLDQPVTSAPLPPDELRLRRARKVLAEFGTLWRNPAVPDQLREEALREILSQVDVDGAEIVAVHPAPNENAWLLGFVAVREQKVTTQREVGLVGARGDKPPQSTLTSRLDCRWASR